MAGTRATGPAGIPLPAARPGREILLAGLPMAAIMLLVALIGLLLFLVERTERERQRATMISDALWVEQTLRFQLSTDEDMVSRLALDTARSPFSGALRDRASLHIANNPEVRSVIGVDGGGAPLFAVPGTAEVPPEALDAMRRSRQSARPVYGPLRHAADGALVFDLVAPIGGVDGAGAVVATLSVSGLVARHVPWWIAERYAVRLVDGAGAVLAEKMRVEPFDPALSHAIAFDPPLAGTSLVIAPYRLPTSRPDFLLYGSIVALSVLAVASLAVLQRHVARRRRLESQLRTETTFRRAMEDSLTVGLRARDHDGRILYVNPAFCGMVGHEAADLIGRGPPMPWWLPDRMAEIRARHEALVSGEPRPQRFETKFRRKDGSVFDALIYEAPLVDADGHHQGWMGSIIDITEARAAAEMARRHAESLQRTGRLVTLGEMASTLAHELNQPLSAIASYAAGSLNMLRAPVPDTAAVAGALEKLAAQAQRAGQIIRRIQDFVRKREPRFTAVDVRDVVTGTVAFAVVDARNAGVRIETDVADPLPAITADRILIEQVLLNLIRNGVEAMAATPPADRLLTVSARRADGQVVIAVADRGAGIDPAVAGRLFDAFVSTKQDGMGMGLNICRSIMELHRGSLTHAPREGGGTVFTLALPAEEAGEAAA